jgi:hypothetical protein
MNPVIGVSVAQIGPSRCILGSMMVCEKVDSLESKLADAIAHWQDGDGTFYLRKRSADDSDLSAGDSEADRIHTAGTSAAVWCLGQDTFIKVHSWIEGVEMETEKIRFVAEKAPGSARPGGCLHLDRSQPRQKLPYYQASRGGKS